MDEILIEPYILAKYSQEKVRKEFGLSLYQRLNEAVYLKRADVHIGNWAPKKHYCHNNVGSWVKHNSQHKHVFGFVYLEVFAILGYVQFAPHSVVEIGDGSLVDITPHDAEFNYPFLRHIGTAAEFAAIAQKGNLNIPLSVIENI